MSTREVGLSRKLMEIERELRDLQQTFDLQWEADMRAVKMWREAPIKEATQAQHFDLPKGEPARFVRNGILETCQCMDCAALSASPPEQPAAAPVPGGGRPD